MGGHCSAKGPWAQHHLGNWGNHAGDSPGTWVWLQCGCQSGFRWRPEPGHHETLLETGTHTHTHDMKCTRPRLAPLARRALSVEAVLALSGPVHPHTPALCAIRHRRRRPSHPSPTSVPSVYSPASCLARSVWGQPSRCKHCRNRPWGGPGHLDQGLVVFFWVQCIHRSVPLPACCSVHGQDRDCS